MEGRLARQQGAAREKAVDVGGTVIKTISLVDENSATARLARRLNGDTDRALRLFYTKARELQETGSVTQGQVIRHSDSTRPAIIGVQSGDSSPAKRVRAFFSREQDVFTLWAICKASEDGKALAALASLGYVQGQRTSRA